MIPLVTTNDPSPHVKARGKACRVKTLGFDSYVVTPPEQGKEKRLVQFDVSEQGVVKVECVAIGTGEVCPANSYSKHCSHVEAAVRRLEKNIAKEHERQTKAQGELKRSRQISREIKKHPSQRRLV